MRKWWYILLGVIVMTTIVTLALHNSSDPVYRGIRLSVWLEGYNRFSQEPLKVRAANQEAASEAVRHLGTNAIPRLLSMLRSQDSDSSRRLVDLLRKQHIIKIPPIQSDDRNYEAEYAFFILGESASNAVPALTKIYGVNGSMESRKAILASLGYIGPAASGAVPFLLQELTNTNVIVRVDCIKALGSIHSQPEIVVPALTRYLHDPSPNVRLSALDSLARFGANALSATTGVLELLKDQDNAVRDRSVYALCRLYAETGTHSFDGKSSEYKSSTIIDVINGLEALGADARPAIPILFKFLTVPDESVRARATRALNAIDADSQIMEEVDTELNRSTALQEHVVK